MASRSLTFVAAIEKMNLSYISTSTEYDRRTEYDLIPFFPHFGNQGLTRIYNARKSRYQKQPQQNATLKRRRYIPDFDVLELAERLHDVLSGDAEEAEAYIETVQVMHASISK